MPTTRRTFLAATFLTILSACASGGDPAPMLGVDASGSSSIDLGQLTVRLESYPVASLSQSEAASLAYMREEERLAHDVYAASAALWPQPIFANIARSESTRTAAVKLLLDRYGLPDPLAGLPEGTFKTPALQALHDTLVAASRVSLVAALKVGVQIEELDIADISAQKAGIDNADILMVYDNLLRGSRNHLRAFVKLLTQQGETYVPQYISQATYDAIVASPIETGP